MKECVVNGALQLQYPDGFHILSNAERSAVNILQEGEWVGLSNPDAHILITVGWKQANGIASMLLNAQDLAKKMEKEIRKAMSSFAFRSDGSMEREIGGMRACGFGYEYVSQGIDMYAEAYAAKRDRTIYYFHFYARSALKDESTAIWRDMLDSVVEQ